MSVKLLVIVIIVFKRYASIVCGYVSMCIV